MLVVILRSGVRFFADVTLSVSTPGKLKNCLTAVRIEPATFGLLVRCLKPLFHSSQKPTRKLPANAFKYCDWMKVSVLFSSLSIGGFSVADYIKCYAYF